MNDMSLASLLKATREDERLRCHRIALDHMPDRPLASRVTASAIASAILDQGHLNNAYDTKEGQKDD